MIFLYALQISDHTISRIPTLAHENNWHEQNVLISLFRKYSSIVGVLSIKGLIFLHLRSFQITERCIRQMGKTLQDVISESLIRLSNREIGNFMSCLFLHLDLEAQSWSVYEIPIYVML